LVAAAEMSTISWCGLTLGVVRRRSYGYVLFYKPGYYIYHPSMRFTYGTAGMSFHGGSLGVTIAIILFYPGPSEYRGCLLGLITGGGWGRRSRSVLFFGFIANFINGELYGRPSNVFLGPGSSRNGGPVPAPPSQFTKPSARAFLAVFILLFAPSGWGCQGAPGVSSPLVSFGIRGFPHVWRSFSGATRIWFPDFGTTDGPSCVDPVVIAGILIIAWALGVGLLARRSARCERGICRRSSGLYLSASSLTICRLLAMALHDPEGGYYARRCPIGSSFRFHDRAQIIQVFPAS